MAGLLLVPCRPPGGPAGPADPSWPSPKAVGCTASSLLLQILTPAAPRDPSAPCPSAVLVPLTLPPPPTAAPLSSCRRLGWALWPLAHLTAPGTGRQAMLSSVRAAEKPRHRMETHLWIAPLMTFKRTDSAAGGAGEDHRPRGKADGCGATGEF